MADRDKIIKYISDYLNSDAIADSSQNGLQVEGRAEVRRAAFAVSQGVKIFEEAAARGADLLVTHHGLIWDKPFRITGVNKKRVGVLIKKGLSLAAWHLPLDMHPVVGNNAHLCKLLALKSARPWGEYHGLTIGFRGEFPKARKFEDIANLLGAKTAYNFSGKKIKTCAVMSGGGHGNFLEAAEAGIDLFITGSAEEYVQELARDSGAAFIAMGHYNSERGGVLNLCEMVKKKFKIETFFIENKNEI